MQFTYKKRPCARACIVRRIDGSKCAYNRPLMTTTISSVADKRQSKARSAAVPCNASTISVNESIMTIWFNTESFSRDLRSGLFAFLFGIMASLALQAVHFLLEARDQATPSIQQQQDWRDQCTKATCDLKYSYWGYLPSLAANGFFAGIFGISLAAFVVQSILGRRFLGFSIAMISGSILEVLGYAGRIVSFSNPFNQNGFLIQIVCLTIGEYCKEPYWPQIALLTATQHPLSTPQASTSASPASS
jgi:hypothetical protein